MIYHGHSSFHYLIYLYKYSVEWKLKFKIQRIQKHYTFLLNLEEELLKVMAPGKKLSDVCNVGMSYAKEEPKELSGLENKIAPEKESKFYALFFGDTAFSSRNDEGDVGSQWQTFNGSGEQIP